jgi:D-alanyl-D-alanine carboxypeptidase (penicillin-binding protein 5/6)
VQAFRPTALWASESPDAPSLAGLPQWTVFRQLGPQLAERLPVEYPGDGAAALPQNGWLTAADVGPSGPPSPHYELASGGKPSPITGRAVPRRTVQAWPQGISAQFAVLLDGDSGEVLWGRDAYGEVAPASLTKIVTAMVALERSRLDDRVTVQVDSRAMYESTVMGITPGENLSMETLLHGLILPSGNDAALAIAQHVGGSERAFVALMNARVAELGLVNSRFANSHGLDASDHYSSPFDISTFARVGMADPTFARVVAARTYQAEGYALMNTNRLLQIYPRADGVKIGYTDAAGRAISASATQDGHRLLAALIRSYNPIPEAQALLEWGFRGFSWDT